MDELKTNVLYYGDNLEILRKYIPDSSIDLIYLDPPFSSKKDYNILFKEATGELSQAQIKAFEDTWHWDKAAEDTYQDIVVRQLYTCLTLTMGTPSQPNRIPQIIGSMDILMSASTSLTLI